MHELLAGCAVLDGEGLTTAFGHLSARTATDDVCISASAGPGLVRDSGDLLTVGLDGSVHEGDPAQLPGEAAIHLAILARRADVASVCRFHGPAALAWSTLGRPLPATTGLVGHEVPWFDTSTTVSTLEDAGRLADRLDDGTAVLLRGFGAVTVGESVAEAVVRAWLLERAAAAVLAASAVAVPLPFAGGAGPTPAQLRRAWNYLTHRWPTTAEVLQA